MATYYVDLETGSDANNGTTYALRKKTIASVTAAVAGDTVRIMASPDETLVGNATWTNNSKTITLAGAVTANISDCETAWTPATNITSTADTAWFKEGTKSAKFVSNATFTTGLMAYFPLGSAVNLSGYQQVSFWMYNAQANADGASLSLRLCSDTAGVTTVNTIALPAMPSTNQPVPVTVNLGTALGASIQSVALYADKAFTSKTMQLDNILACKAASSADSLNLNSVIGKGHNRAWVASTAYALNDIRKPTQPNRNGFRYKVTTAGTTGSTEPTWPTDVGLAVTDGSVTWACEGLEDTFYPIRSINGTTVILDTYGATAPAGQGYQGATETVATIKREVILTPSASLNSASFLGSAQNTLSAGSGTAVNPLTYSGGWNRTDMSSQIGETWVSGVNNYGYGIDTNSKNYISIVNYNPVRFIAGIYYNAGTGLTLYNSHLNFHSNGVNATGSATRLTLRGVIASLCQTAGFNCAATDINGTCVSANGNGGNAPQLGVNLPITRSRFNYVVAKGNVAGAIGSNQGSPLEVVVNNLTTGNNTGSSVIALAAASYTLNNAVIPEATPFFSPTAFSDAYIYSQKHQGVANNHLITTDGGTIVSATDQLYTAATGISWKFRPISTNRGSAYPLRLSVAKIRCAANTAVNVTIPTRRDNTNIKGQLVVAGGQIAGVGTDVVVDCQPAINTWVVSSALTFTPTEDGVVEITFRAWDGVGTANNFWISTRDLTVA